MRRLLVSLFFPLMMILGGCNWMQFKAGITEIELTTQVRSEVANHGGISGRAAYAFDTINIVAIDHDCVDDGVCIDQLGDNTFWVNHEYGHIVDRKLGHPFGDTAIGHEMGANAVAEIITGHGPNYTVDAEGYVDIPRVQLVWIRDLMIMHNIIEVNEFIIPEGGN